MWLLEGVDVLHTIFIQCLRNVRDALNTLLIMLVGCLCVLNSLSIKRIK